MIEEIEKTKQKDAFLSFRKSNKVDVKKGRPPKR
jgi:hypothetical protein